jgi:UDP-glucuronate decarboxylase
MKIIQKKILVTGGAGFLGSHLCEKLILLGHKVFCVDNFYTGSLDNIKNLLINDNFKVIKHDVVNLLNLEVDEIFNLACPASPKFYQLNPIKTTMTSVIGAYNMLLLAKSNNSRIFQASTSEVYGDPKINPQSEEYWGNVNPIGIRSCYDEGKRCAESLFFDFHRESKVKIKVARIFNTYGPRMQPDDGRVVSNFIVQALQGKPLTIYGRGDQTRSFCYVDDLIDAFILFMNSPDSITGPLNLGNPNEFTVLELAELVIKLVNSKSVLKYSSLPMDDPKLRRPNLNNTLNTIKWKPTTHLESGLNKTISYFDELLKNQCYITK